MHMHNPAPCLAGHTPTISSENGGATFSVGCPSCGNATKAWPSEELAVENWNMIRKVQDDMVKEVADARAKGKG